MLTRSCGAFLSVNAFTLLNHCNWPLGLCKPRRAYQATALGTNVTVASVCARVRSSFLLSLVDDGRFNAFARSHWAKQVFHDLLQSPYDKAQLKKIGRKRVLEKIYLYGVDEQFTDLTVPQKMIKDWEAAVNHVTVSAPVPLSGTGRLCSDWLRRRLTPGRIFGVVSDAVRIVPYSSYADHGEEACALQDIVALASCEELVGIAAPVLPKLTYFRVVNAYPNRRTLKHPHHLGRKPNVIAIVRYQVIECGDDGHVILQPGSAFEADYLDLSYTCSCKFTSFAESLWCFHGIEYGCKLEISKGALRVLSDSPVPLPRPWSNSRDALAMVPSDLSQLPTDAHRVFAQLAQSCSFSEPGNFRHVTTLHAYTSELAERLLSSGLAECQRTEAGEIESIGLTYSAVQHAVFVRMTQPSLEFNLPEHASCASNHSKLDLARILLRQGFQASWSALQYWDDSADTPDEFRAQALVSGSKLYLVALVLRHEIVARKGFILHNGSAKYYRLLLVLKDLTPLSALKDDPHALMPADLDLLAKNEQLHEPLLAIDDSHEAEDAGLEDDAVPDYGQPESSLDAVPVHISKFAAETAALRPVIYGNAVIHFDNCSHSSGKLRAYTTCNVHRRCTQHCQVETAGGRNSAIARLQAWLYWVQSNPGMPRCEHSGHPPPADLIADFYRRVEAE